MIRLQACFLADRAILNVDGTFMVWRGGIYLTMVPEFPTTLRYALVLRLELDEESARDLHSVGIQIMYNGEDLGTQTGPVAVATPAAGDQYSYFTMLADLRIAVNDVGVGEIRVVVDEEIGGPHLPFRVVPFDPAQSPPLDPAL